MFEWNYLYFTLLLLSLVCSLDTTENWRWSLAPCFFMPSNRY